MLTDTYSTPLVNWPLFIFTSLVICLRTYAPSICIWILNRYKPASTTTIDSLIDELKRLKRELETISQQDEFAAYVRKERQINSLTQRLKDEKTQIETKEMNILTYTRLILNIGTVLIMIYLTITGQRHQSIPLFNFPFFRFPLIIWIMSLHTFVVTLPEIYIRFRTNKKTTD